jgi:hypothetical protein
MFCDSRRISSIYLAENLDRRVAVHPLGELVEQEAVKNSMFLGPKGCVGSFRGRRSNPHRSELEDRIEFAWPRPP